MLILVSAIAVLSLLNTFLLYATLSVAGLLRREYSENTAALVDCHNYINNRVATLEDTCNHALMCLVTIDAERSNELEEAE